MANPARNNAANSAAAEDPKRNRLLAALRVASAHLRLAKNEVDCIGTALKGGLITDHQALDWLEDVGALPLIDAVVGGANE